MPGAGRQHPLIFVRVEFGALFTDEDGTTVAIDEQPAGTWDGVSDSLYRRNAWQGLFLRRLTRVRGFGREFWIDEMAVRMARARGEVAAAEARYERIAPEKATKRGCGCGGGATVR